MYKSKKDVDKLVENLSSKLSEKEFQTRAYSIAQKYFEVGDYTKCQSYVEQYLTHKDNSAAAYKLLGLALHRMGLKEKALEQYKASLDIDPAQTSIILDICELLADDEVIIDPGRAKYWCEKAEATFPRHAITFKLRERLISVSNPDSEALVKLLTSQLSETPKDVFIHVRLIQHYLNNNKINEAFNHACNMEFGGNIFINNYIWYDVLNELLRHSTLNATDWLYQLLLLTVKERICLLSITETPSSSSKSLVESNELLHAYDQAINKVTKLGASPGYGEFHNGLIKHHRGQVALHAASILLKKAKKDQLSWPDANKFAAPLMLLAWQTCPLDLKVNWLKTAAGKQITAVNRWYTEGSYRCSQAGHYLLSFIQDKNQSFLDQVSQCFSGAHWRDKIYKKLFSSQGHWDKMNLSYFASAAFSPPVFRIPRNDEVEAYDNDAQKQYANSLHHFIWTLLNYKNFATFNCTHFDMLQPATTATTCAPETLNKLDVLAFLYCATFTAKQKISKDASYMTSDKPTVLPANITELLCPLSQMKWWDCAYKFSQNEIGTESTDIRGTISRGIEVVRCFDNHGLDPELLCYLGRIFNRKAEISMSVEDKSQLEERASLYYQSAVPLLEKLKSKIVEKIFGKRMFSYTHEEIGTKELNTLLEECKLYIASSHLNKSEYEKAIQTVINLKSPQAYHYIAISYKNIAIEDVDSSKDAESRSKFATLLSKAKTFAFKALDQLRDNESNKSNTLYLEVQKLIQEIETLLNKIEPDFKIDGDGKYSSDENVSGVSEYLPSRNNSRIYRDISSTPKAPVNASKYRTAMDSQMLENTRINQSHLDKIENEIKNLQIRDSNISDFMNQTKCWFEENRKLGNEIISTIHSNMQSTTDQFKLLKLAVDQVKGEIDECRNEYKDVGDMKKDIAELKKEVSKLRKVSPEQNIDDSELYNLEDEYRTNDSSTTSFASRLPFSASQVLPQFNQRLVPPFPVPPNTYQLYNQNLYSLYNQYSQFAQPPAVPTAQSLFDPTRAQVNYPGVFPTPDQMYLDVAHLAPPSGPMVPTVPPVPVASTISSAPIAPAATVPPPAAIVTSSKTFSKESKETLRSLPANVVITSSDPLPTCTTTPAPALSVTIPPKHIKGLPHNYQIAMPSTNDTSVTAPPKFVFPMNKATVTFAGNFSNSNQSSVFQTTPMNSTSMMQSLLQDSPLSVPKLSADTLDTSRTVIDGMFGITSSPNTSLNKSRTISEKSNTSVENYDPCPDFKPIVPLPAEVKVTTGEEDETTIFGARAKLFRFVDKEWKERGIGEMKLLKHKTTGKVRVLMRREQIHKICANHIITADMEIKPMKNETKAYFWVANDFADESVVLEKFCIRFKTADIAKDFYDAFEKARQESMANKPSAGVAKSDYFKIELPNFGSTKISQTIGATQGKAVIGGFTFSSTPTFKSVSDDTGSEAKNTQEGTTNRVNVFSKISFKTNTSSPSNNVFTSAININNPSNTMESAETSTSIKLNSSDIVEEFEPNIDFKPVVALPALIDQKTGEEDESILFEQRAKLLRFDAAAKEWKERGLGNIKLLVHKDNVQKVRLLMRREQIMKVCCNHAITKDMIFQKMPNVDKAVTWCAKDFSEGELVAETFCLRFKTVELCDKFMDAVKSAQLKIKDESKTEKEEKNTANQTGFGDKFKPKAGSWHCGTCYTNNLESFANCACCDTPNPNATTQIKEAPKTTSNVPVTVGFGDKFKPKAGSWECQACLVRNDPAVECCTACNSPKDPTKPKPTVIVENNAPKFNFGIPSSAVTAAPVTIAAAPVANPAATVGTGRDLLKPTLSNNKSIFDTTGTGTTQFRFGISPITNEQNANTASIFDGTGGHKFSFGMPTNKFFGSETTTSLGETPNDVFGTPKVVTENVPVDFTVKNNKPFTFTKPALLPTPQTEQSPIKSTQKDDHSDGDEYAEEEECHQSFTPVVPLPEKIDVVTGEENEIELYGHMAKLYRFTSSEWKERGKGIVKILKHKDTGKLRVVMRRDQVLKICLNHALTSDINYSLKEEKSWLFTVNDFSEGKIALEHFCLKFRNKEITLQFKEAIDKALQDLPVEEDEKPNPVKDESDEVIFVNEIQASKEDKERAKELMLPENFYTYKNKDPCQGCRGCQDDEEAKSKASTFETPTEKSNIFVTSETKPVLATSVLKTALTLEGPSTPAKVNTPLFQSPTNSLYGTPTNLDKTSEVDTSSFRTPLGLMSSNSKTPLPSHNIFGNSTTNKENTLIQKPSIFSGFKKNDTVNETLSTLNTANESQKEPSSKFSFGSLQNKSVFTDNPFMPGNTLGMSTNKSIFNIKSDNEATEAKTLFGDSNKSIFGMTKQTSNVVINSNANQTIDTAVPKVSDIKSEDQKTEKTGFMFGVDNSPSFATLSSTTPAASFNQKIPNFKWQGAGQQLFVAAKESVGNNSHNDTNENDEVSQEGAEEYDPHYAPIVPLPDKIVVTTGEEDEERLFGERCKLYRFDEKSREWRERGIGEMKILYHPEKNTYRFLLRREQVYKAVLNMLLHMDLQLLPMKNSDRAWTLAGRNFAENPAGEQETLAVRFKSVDLSTTFFETVQKCVRKLQAAAAKAVQEETKANDVPPLRLPKHLEESARADNALSSEVIIQTSLASPTTVITPTITTPAYNVMKSEMFGDTEDQEVYEDQEDHEYHEDDEDHEDHEDQYVEEEEEEEYTYYACDGEAIIQQGNDETTYSFAHIQVVYDLEYYMSKILITDPSTGEILAAMIIHPDTEFKMADNSCTWSGKDNTAKFPVDKTITVNFFDNDTAMQFYQRCEMSKAS